MRRGPWDLGDRGQCVGTCHRKGGDTEGCQRERSLPLHPVGPRSVHGFISHNVCLIAIAACLGELPVLCNGSTISWQLRMLSQGWLMPTGRV